MDLIPRSGSKSDLTLEHCLAAGNGPFHLPAKEWREQAKLHTGPISNLLT